MALHKPVGTTNIMSSKILVQGEVLQAGQGKRRST